MEYRRAVRDSKKKVKQDLDMKLTLKATKEAAEQLRAKSLFRE